MNILSGDLMDTSELINQVQENITFRVTSARDMITGIRGESEMSPLQRRRRIRENRLKLIGMGPDEDMSASDSQTDEVSGTVGENFTPSTSNTISQGSTSGRNIGSESNNSTSHGVPSMSETQMGTKGRAEDHGFDT